MKLLRCFLLIVLNGRSCWDPEELLLMEEHVELAALTLTRTLQRPPGLGSSSHAFSGAQHGWQEQGTPRGSQENLPGTWSQQRRWLATDHLTGSDSDHLTSRSRPGWAELPTLPWGLISLLPTHLLASSRC